MNTRCFRCGWSFSLSRETIENAVANAGTEKIHVEYCPRCRQVIKIPIQQLKRALPPGWTPEARPEEAGAGTDTAAAEMPAAAADTPAAEPEPAPRPSAARKRAHHRQAPDGADTEPAEEASPATDTQTRPRTRQPAASAAPTRKTTKKATRTRPKP